MTVYIYSLSDPRSPEAIRYIGKAKNISSRLRSHIIKARLNVSQTHCANWIRSLLSEGVKPTLTILKTVSDHEWQLAEIESIRAHRQLGHDLTNVCKGGEGSSMEPETRAKLSAIFKGRKLPASTCEKLSRSQIGRKHSAETKQKMSLSRPRSARSAWVDKGKATGERHWCARLTIEHIREIRASNETSAELAVRFGISRAHAASVKSGKKWAHVT